MRIGATIGPIARIWGGSLTRSVKRSAAMRRLVPFVAALLIGTVPAAASVVVTIDKSTQQMTV